MSDKKFRIELMSLPPEDFAEQSRDLWGIPVYMDWTKLREALWPPPTPHQRFKVLIELVQDDES